MINRHATVSALVVAAVMAMTTSQAQTPPIRIMPLGDEITYGQGVAGGYRLPLYVALTNAGYTVDYVGTQTSNPTNALPDSNHQGQVTNWRINGGTTGLDETLYQWLAAIDDPDVVLLHIGANDTNSTANAITRLDALITRIATNRPSANIIVTTLLPRGDAYSNYVTQVFNPNVATKVNAQRALGRKVYFLDMFSCLTTNDLTGTPQLFPSAAGYAKMAGAWYTAVTNIVSPYGDTSSPAISRALGITNRTQVAITFTKPLNPATATNLGNYAISGGLSLTRASLSADQRTVTLTTTPQTKDTPYTVTVNNVTDLTPTPGPLSIAANSTVTFKAVCRGYLSNVAESANYTLLYSLDLPNSANYGATYVPYSVDNSVLLDNGTVKRVAYYAELQTPNGQMTYLWASMDPFTNILAQFGVPTTNTVAINQRLVSNLTVQSNDPNITNGSVPFGNIEFWACNYDALNSNNIPGASGAVYDCGDRPTPTGTYGCMQIHNYAAAQTLFSFGNWGTTSGTAATPDIGIGNCPSPRNAGNDWTFSTSAGMYTIKSLQVLIRRDVDTTPPTLVSAKAGTAGTLVTVTFSEPLNPDSVSGTRFALDNGVGVIGATLLSDLRTVNLLTTAQPAGATLTLTVNGVRDSAAGNAVAPNSTITVAAPALPPEIVANVGSMANGYQLVYTLDVPLKGNFNAASDFYRYNQSLATGAFDRVAYYVELVPLTGGTQYLWTAMDTFTPYRNQIGVPVAAAKAAFQLYVTNMEVKCNVAGVSNGTFATGCNIEFWASSYTATNSAAVTNASNAYYDWGDSGGTATAGHGCMQIHNSALSHVLFGMSNFGQDNNVLSIGIGNRPGSNDKDWTNAGNSGAYSRRLLHVLVRPSAPGTGNLPPEVAANIPIAAGYALVCSITNIPIQTRFQDATNYYTFDKRSSVVAGSFSRVAYYMELQKSGTPVVTQFVWTAMDEFTTDPTKIGVPVGGTYFQQKVANLDVLSNVASVSNGTGIATGNIEFWPSSYTSTNAAGIPGASNSTFDFGDGGASSGAGGYGSMQVHNYGAAQTLFAMNNFNTTNSGVYVCLGIGNQPTGNPDWTHSYNAPSYDLRRVLHVFVLPGGDNDIISPALTAARGSTALNQVLVTFSETLSDNASAVTNFTLSGGVSVTGAALQTNRLSVLLTTTAQTAGQTYTVTVSGVRDRSSNGNLIVPGSTVTFTAPACTLPAAITNSVPEIGTDGYQLVYQLPVQNTLNYISAGAPYTIDESRFFSTQTFDRVAYCLELLTTNGVYKWAYVSMDAFTADKAKIGVPTPDRGAFWQQYVSNLNVYASANVANISVTTGVGIAAGNIEFWPSSYNQNNDKAIPGALGVVSGTNYFDCGDSTGNAGAGHGCMQIHNYLAGHTILAFNHFGNNNQVSSLGIGNNTNFTSAGNIDYDWTFNYNGPLYSTKNLYVFVRPGPTPPALAGSAGVAPAILTQPRAQVVHERETFYFSVQATGATRYQWRRNGVPITGATLAYLEVPNAHTANEGTYDALVYGTGTAYTTSGSATLDVLSLGALILFR